MCKMIIIQKYKSDLLYNYLNFKKDLGQLIIYFVKKLVMDSFLEMFY